MKYCVKYVFSAPDQDDEIIGEYLVGDPLDSVPFIEKMCYEEDTLYIYSNESGDRLDITYDMNNYLVRDLMGNGFFQKRCNLEQVIEIVKTFGDSKRDPVLLGMESFG